jgi:hypothetical protein
MKYLYNFRMRRLAMFFYVPMPFTNSAVAVFRVNVFERHRKIWEVNNMIEGECYPLGKPSGQG